MRNPARRYRYGAFHGGDDPLAAPPDLRSALDEIGRDVMDGSSPASALRELLRRGTAEQRGLDDLMRQVWRRRSELQRRHRLDGTAQEVRRLLDQALTAERAALAGDNSEDAQFRQLELDALPSDTGGAVRELAGYDWRSPEARDAYEQIRQLLGTELLDQRFRGIKQAMQQVGPQDVERIQAMLGDLNALLDAHARGDADTPQRFAEFMTKHGEFFPENPANVDELIDLLAQRSAAAQRLMNSMSAEQRAELGQLAQQAFGDPSFARSLAGLDARLQALRPGEDWSGRSRFRGDQPLGIGEATQALEQLGELDQLAEQLSQSYPGASMEDIDLDALTRQLGGESAVDARRLAELEKQLRQQGFLRRAPDGSLRLTPKALRRLGQSTLQEMLDRLRTRHGQRRLDRAGSAGEPTGASREWEFGDTEPWDVVRTVRNAVLRTAAEPAAHPDAEQGTGPSGRVRLDVGDVEVVDTEQRSRAAVALCVDTSWSMVQDGRWLPMKRTALALHHLVSTRFRTDALQLITFGRHAKTVDLAELTELEGVWEQGTNLHHALLLAGRHLHRNPDAVPVIIVVTDGEPTAHLEPDGEAIFNYPPLPETLAKTLNEIDSLARHGAAITVFMLGDDPRLAAFVDLLARRSGGRVVAPDLDGLGAEVIADYLGNRRRRH